MKKNNENQFVDKFRFLHSQESIEDISWSYSDSSDYEHDNNNQYRTLSDLSNGIGRKRKRANIKEKRHKNISNLDVTVLDNKSEKTNAMTGAKSPILVTKLRCSVIQKSPIINTLQSASKTTNRTLNNSAATFNHFNVSTDEKTILKSPIVNLENNSPKLSSSVRKKLFKSDKCINFPEGNRSKRSRSPILSSKKDVYERRKCMNTYNIIEEQGSNKHEGAENKCLKDHQSNCKLIDRIKNCSNDESIEYFSSQESVPKKQLVAKVRSFFDNHFNSEASQQSISEYETSTSRSESKSSNDIDITTPKTQEFVTFTRTLSTNTFESHNIDKQKKKVKFKKGGLSYRLNALLKKQNSSVSLWQHERFLAANSNFVIPKQEFSVYRIKNVCFKYGLYLLEIVNRDDEFFIAFISCVYVNNNAFDINSVLKIYEPFKIVNTSNNCKIICNICKFECEKLMI